MNKPVYLGLSILEISKIIMYEFWYDYVKPKYRKKAKFCYMDTGSFLVYIKTRHLCRNCKRCWNLIFDISSYELERPLPKGKKIRWFD